ncbi:MAG TPA: addiction module protein [Candidatus Kapabacteria bacterium]|nr:addiction module protein [Candidatus Kapabacteria bacterium]HPO61591.1 addiction module protein [Candidatus Kapabacteria bacterium]
METLLKEDIINTILSMPPTDRIEIIDKVYEDFDSHINSENERLWAIESEKRLDDFFNGSIAAKEAVNVFKRINELQ